MLQLQEWLFVPKWLNAPPPDTIDHAPVVAPPPILAPLSVIAEGVAD